MPEIKTALDGAKRYRVLIVVVIALAVLIKIFAMPRIAFVEVSPDQQFRLEYFYPGRLQSTYYRYVREMELAEFARLYRNADNKFFGESPVIDFSPGMQTMWLIDEQGLVSINSPHGHEFTGVNRQAVTK